MFPFPIAKPQNCDIQTFYSDSTWAKPPGVSHVYMLLISSGGPGDGGSVGGGSSGVTVWYGAAQHVPNTLSVQVSPPGGLINTMIFYLTGSAARVTLLLASRGSNNTGGVARTPNQFAAAGFFNSVAGQDGSTTSISASATTFLSGGADASINSVDANYGYSNQATNVKGFFQLQPIIVGGGGSGDGVGGIGCGGGRTGVGGPGMALIASW